LDILVWLRSLGLERYEALFRDHEIDAEVLPELSDADLAGLGIPLGSRKKLLKAIAALGRDVPSPALAAAAAAVKREAERRQLTVMFCDLVGSTALSQRLDPEDLRDIILTFRTACADCTRRFEGYIARYVGDGLLI